jgi:hypothetical protein
MCPFLPYNENSRSKTLLRYQDVTGETVKPTLPTVRIETYENRCCEGNGASKNNEDIWGEVRCTRTITAQNAVR